MSISAEDFNKPPMIEFIDANNDNEKIGRLEISNGKLVFIGNADESAKKLFNSLEEIKLIVSYNELSKEKLRNIIDSDNINTNDKVDEIINYLKNNKL